VTEIFHFDLYDYMGTAVIEPETVQAAELVSKELKDVAEGLKSLNRHMESLKSIAGASGLDLSVTTLRNLRQISTGGPVPVKMNPTGQPAELFSEILGVDWKTGSRLEQCFRYRPTADLQSVPGDVVERLPEFFDMEAWRRDSKSREAG
jgi:hypothetical protein